VEAQGDLDFTRRLHVMNEMGIARQLVFPSFGRLLARHRDV
jgi:hypothetical protein